MSVIVQKNDFDISKEVHKIRENKKNVGAVVTFVGLVRDMNSGRKVNAITLEHYPKMTKKALESIVLQAKTRWKTEGIRLIHRYGTLKPSDQIVLVIVSSQHRKDAFEACEFLMDFLKTQAPFWKKEVTDSGESWVEFRTSDELAANRWVRN